MPREEIDFDPTKIDAFNFRNLKLNGIEVDTGIMPWILEEVEEKIYKVCKKSPIESLEIECIDCNSSVMN